MLGDGVGVVGGSGAIGGSDLDQRGAGVAQDIGDAEAAADLDGLASGNDDLPPTAMRGHGEVKRGGVVVDRDPRLCTSQGLKRGFEVIGAGASGSRVEVELQVGVAARRL